MFKIRDDLAQRVRLGKLSRGRSQIPTRSSLTKSVSAKLRPLDGGGRDGQGSLCVGESTLKIPIVDDAGKHSFRARSGS